MVFYFWLLANINIISRKLVQLLLVFLIGENPCFLLCPNIAIAIGADSDDDEEDDKITMTGALIFNNNKTIVSATAMRYDDDD